MSARIYKLLRRYAKLRKLNYNVCKQVYFKSTPEMREVFRKDMEIAPYNNPIIKVNDRLTGKTKTIRLGKIKKPAFEIKDMKE